MFLKQVGALIRKEIIVSKRSPKGTCCEILLPVIIGVCVGLFMLLVGLVQNLLGDPDEYLYSTAPESFAGWFGSTPLSNIYGNEVVGAVQLARQYLNFTQLNVSTYATEGDMFVGYQNYSQASPYVWTSFVGLQSHPYPVSYLNSVPLNYSLFVGKHDLGRAAAFAAGLIGLFYELSTPGHPARYPLTQRASMMVNKSSTERDIFVLINFKALAASSGAVFLIYAFIPALLVTAARLVSEKKNKVRESLKVMGVTNGAYVFSGIIAAWIRVGIGSVLVAFALAASKAIEPGSIPVVMGIGALYAISIIGFAQIVCGVFSTPSLAYVVCILFLWGSATVTGISTGFGLPVQLTFCLLSPVSFFYAILPEISQGSVQLEATQSMALGMMAADAFLYIIIGQYIYQVAPGEYGVPKHPLFFLGFGAIRSHEIGLASPTKKELDPGVRVIINSLVKYYGNNRDNPAVNGLTMGIKEKEIFALLGHNGAGKTTTISMLTGMIKASDYVQCTVDGLDITRDIGQIRQNIGLCPQFDVLYDDLTAREHLELFSRIKGREADQDRINYLLNELELVDESKVASKFSGGMRRRLSVGNALVGGANLVFLDEPSSGMDPLNRRRMWNLLKAERDMGKTLVLTTHFMEEADYLGDRIAIMSHGKLYCCNTSQQLKDTYGVGFYISLVKPASDPARAKVEEAQKLIQDEVGPSYRVTLHQNTSGDATFMLPTSALPKFGHMLTKLEAHLHLDLHFDSYGVSMNTLEDVFITVSKREEATRKAEIEAHKNEKAGITVKEEAREEGSANILGGSITSKMDHFTVAGRPVADFFAESVKIPHGQRVRAQAAFIFKKKFSLLARNRRMQLLVFLFPFLFMVLAFASLQQQPPKDNISQFDGSNAIDYENMDVIFVNMGGDMTQTNRVRGAFETVFHRAHPTGNIIWRTCNDWDDYTAGTFIPVHSLNFFKGVQQPPYPVGFYFHKLDLNAATPHANFTIMYNNKFTYSGAGEFASYMHAAIELAAGNNNTDVLLYIKPENFPTGTFNGTGIVPVAAPPQGVTYTFMSIGVNLVISLVMLLTNCVLPVADDFNRGVYHVLRCSGMTASAYFLGNMAFDSIVLLWPFVLFTAGVYIKGVGAYYSGVIFLVLLAGIVYAFHIMMHCYILAGSRKFGPIGIVVVSQALNLATLAVPYLMLLGIKNASSSFEESIKPFVLSFFPATSFYHILDNASDMTEYTTSMGYLFTFSGIKTGWGFIFLIVELIVPLLLIRKQVLEQATHIKLKKDKNTKAATATHETKRKQTETAETPLLAAPHVPVNGDTPRSLDEIVNRDPDVVQEEARVLNARPNDNMVAVKKLLKLFGYQGNAKCAVDTVTFGIKRGECFGLLGPNGAGKTTTCKCILKQEEPDDGEISFDYTNLPKNSTRDDQFIQSRLGVCAQTDTLWEHLSAQEHMEYYLSMRLAGTYNPQDWQKYVEETICKVQLDEAGNRPAGGFSGGMKRKLAVCLAMYTGAQTVLLDEPSTGMDPFARRALWGVILQALSEDRAVLLTTHSMEEADAVCARIAIMTGGIMRCIGSSQHLKNRFGSGYVVSLSIEPEADGVEVDRKVLEFFGKDAEMTEAIGTQRKYSVGVLPSLASTFAAIETRRKEWQVVHYSVAQTSSLEQIFLNFAGGEHAAE
jgi:ATP-binding cassette subfamily A (ABC1) protein 3